MEPFPRPQYVGVFPQFCVQHQSILVLKEKTLSLSGDSFHIKDVAGNSIVTCRGKTMSISDRKDFSDFGGNLLFTLRKRHFHIHTTFEAETPSGQLILTVKSHFTILGSKMQATFKNTSDGRDIELLVKGDWLDRKATITMNGQVVAQIGRNFMNAREILCGKQTYQVSVAPGIDLAIMAAICICLDEKKNEHE